MTIEVDYDYHVCLWGKIEVYLSCGISVKIKEKPIPRHQMI
jgi:hypothetical protein